MGLVRRLPVDTTSAEQTNPTGSTSPAPLDTEALREQLRSGDADARRCAAADLREVPQAVGDLLACRLTETDGTVREAILTALSSHDVPTVGLGLADDLRSEDPGTRNAAVRALATMPVATAAAVEAGLLTDDDTDVRILAVMVLATLPSTSVPAWLSEVVAGDADQRVVAAAVDVAATLGGELATELAPLAASRFPEDPFLAFLASTLTSAVASPVVPPVVSPVTQP